MPGAGGGLGGAYTPSFANPNAPDINLPGGAGAGSAGAGGSTAPGAFTPDWKALIAGDPGLIDAQNAITAGGVQDLAGRNAAISRALVGFGKVPDFASLAKQLGMTEEDLKNAAGGDVQQLAAENTAAGTSTEARLSQANTDAIRQIRNELNRRGLLNSGETGFQLDRQNTGYRGAEYDANQKLLDYINQYQAGYVAAQQQKQEALATAYSSAADRQFQANSGGASAAGPTYTPPAPAPTGGSENSAGGVAHLGRVDSAGHPVYVGPNGAEYNADGTPYTPPAAAPAPAPQPAPDVTSVLRGARVGRFGAA